MADLALVIDGVVANVYRDVRLARDEFSPVNANRLFNCPAETEAGWLYDVGADAFTPPSRKLPSDRELRRKEYRQVLATEPGDDEITVLGDTVDKLLAQVEVIRQRSGAPATSEWSDLLAKVAAVKAKIPKKAG